MYNNSMGKNMGAFRKGFTIIEVMLFLALSGLLLVGILGGLGGNIARQRYNDAVQDTVNMLRDQYSFVTDTEIAVRSSNDASCYGLVGSDIQDNPLQYFRAANNAKVDSVSYRGRTNCVIYGAVVNIHEDYMETTELIGRDYQAVLKERGEELDTSQSDMEILKNISSANNLFYHCDDEIEHCYIRSADNSRIQYAKWGTKFLDTKGEPMHKTLLIFRSPRNGAIRTYVWDGAIIEKKDGDKDIYVKYEDINAKNNGSGEDVTAHNIIDDYGINQYLDSAHFQIKDLDICVDSGDAQTFSNARRLIKVQRGGSGQNAVELINLDIAKEAAEGRMFDDGVYECQ